MRRKPDDGPHTLLRVLVMNLSYLDDGKVRNMHYPLVAIWDTREAGSTENGRFRMGERGDYYRRGG